MKIKWSGEYPYRATIQIAKSTNYKNFNEGSVDLNKSLQVTIPAFLLYIQRRNH